MNQKGRRVLIVSADLEIPRALSHALTLGGYAVTTATDWSEAMEVLRSKTPQAVLYDVKDLDRREWVRVAEVRKAHPEVPVVLLASLGSRELDRALGEGLIDAYQVKPINLTALERCLESAGGEGRMAHSS